MNKHKRLLSLLLAVVMVIGMVPLTAVAQDGETQPAVASCEYCKVDLVEGALHSVGCPTTCTCDPKPAEGEAHAVGCPLNLTPVTTSLDGETTGNTTGNTTNTTGNTTSTTEGTTAATTQATTVATTEATTAPTVLCDKCGTTESNEDGTVKHAEDCETLKPLCDKCNATKNATDDIIHAEDCITNCICGTEDGTHIDKNCRFYVAPPVYDQLAAAKTLADFRAIMMAEENRDAVWNLTAEEITNLIAEVEALYAAVENPTQDDKDLHEELIETLNYLPAMECPECGEFGGHAEYCIKNIQILPAAVYDNVLYFDLAIKDVVIDNGKVTGSRYDGKTTGYNTYENISIANREIYVYQSNGDRNTGVIQLQDGTQKLVLPEYERVSDGNWGTYITNNTNVDGVISEWEKEATEAGREPVLNCINIQNPGSYKYIVTIDNLWSNYQECGTARKCQLRTTGGIGFWPYRDTDSSAQLTIKVKGDNRLANIFYSIWETTGISPMDNGLDAYLQSCRIHAGNKKLIITDYDGDGQTGNTLTVANARVDAGDNYFGAAIGGSDNKEIVMGMEIKGATIFAGTTEKDNATAIGGGGNGYTELTISGGRITAVCHSGGAAIGGGIGATHWGGYADITITDGTVYAYNYGPYANGGQYYLGHGYYAPGVAIGSGSSCQYSTTPANVKISGGKVYAFSNGGVAIGGGGAIQEKGSDAIISITGGDVTAIATPISDTSGLTNPKYTGGLTEFPACVGIGGGTGIYGGGDCTLTISGPNTVVRTSSIGGGRSLSDAYKIGSANVTISDGATVHGQVVMAAGASQDCSLTIDGATINNSTDFGGSHEYYYIRENGGVAYIENGTATVTNSKIIGGGTGGMLDNGTVNNLNDDIAGDHIQNGGAIYVNGGSFIMESGTITDCEAVVNGGAVYVDGGTCNLNGGIIQNNTAVNGGAVYVSNTSVTFGGTTGITIQNNTAENGAGLYISQTADSNLTTTVSNGNITGNIASQNGGGIYHTGGAGTCTVSGSGAISENEAVNGGGIYVAGDSTLTVTGGIISKNKATGVEGTGGGIYVESGKFSLVQETAATPVGIHSNTAVYAANDVYAAGKTTVLNLPEVSGMDLNGYNGKATGWFADYHDPDSEYPTDKLGSTNPGRYDVKDEDNVRVEANPKLKDTDTYLCLTLGKTYGDLIIKKHLKNGTAEYNADQDMVFLFTITSNDTDKTGMKLVVPVTVKKGQSIGVAQVSHLEEGNYIITEDDQWSWRFTVSVKEQNFAIESEATAAKTVNFTNTLNKTKWLDGETKAENVFGSTGVTRQ